MSSRNKEHEIPGQPDAHGEVSATSPGVVVASGELASPAEQPPAQSIGAAAADAHTRSQSAGSKSGLQRFDHGDRDHRSKYPKDTSQGSGLLEREANEADAINESMPSSIATLKPTTTTAVPGPYLSVELSASLVDPASLSPASSRPPSRTSGPRSRNASTTPSPTRSDAAFDDRRYASEDEQERGSKTEIQSIMEQFNEAGGGPGIEEVMSPRLEIASPRLSGPVQHPPRKSSLEPLAPSITQQLQEMEGLSISTPSPSSSSLNLKEKEPEERRPPVPPKDDQVRHRAPGPVRHNSQSTTDLPMSPIASLHRPPPPEPEPEPALPFDFHRFLEQLRNKKADPIARYLKSFLTEFGKRQWMVHEQVKIISDFLAFISNKMAQCEVWRNVSDAEFDNAREGMEKLVMNRLYTQTFSPAIPPPQPIPGIRPKKKGGERPMGPGRRGQHQEDVERDEVLAQKISIYNWVKEEHLDIPPVGEGGKRFLKLAQQELLKINSYRAPRDKIICILNCCKVIFGLLKHTKSDLSADSFMPLLIYVVLKANPDNLVSNVQYILRFRNQEKLGGEAGYYLSSLMGAIQFIENMDRTTLTISDEEFERNVEAAVSAIAEKHRAESPPPPPPEKSTPLRPASARPSADVDRPARPRRSSSSNDARDSGEHSSSEERPAIAGLLRTIQKPLSTIGRIFSDEPSLSSPQFPSHGTSYPIESGPSVMATPVRTPQPEGPRSNDRRSEPQTRQRMLVEEAAARQASAEAEEARRLHQVEHANIVDTLASMFPDLDRDVISDVVHQKQGRVGQAVDACLALSA